MSKLQNENTKWTLSQDWFSIKRFDFSIEKFSATLIVPKYEILGYWVIRQILWNTGILPENAYVANSYQKLIWIGIQTMGCICYIKEFGSLYYRCEYNLVILAWPIPKWYLFIYLFTYLFIYLFIDILSTTHYKCTVNFSGMPYIILKSGNLWLILIEVGRLFHNKLRRKISKFRS